MKRPGAPMQPSGDRRQRLANSLPMTLRVYRKLSSAMVPLAPALIKRRLKLKEGWRIFARPLRPEAALG